MRRSASSDAILSSYLYGRWPRLDALNADYYMKIQPRAIQQPQSQPRSSAEMIGANPVLDHEALEDADVSWLCIRDKLYCVVIAAYRFMTANNI